MAQAASRISCRAALRPGSPITPPPGWQPAPQRNRRGARHGADHEELIEREFRVMPVTPGDAELALDVRRREQLHRADAVAQLRRVSAEGIDYEIGEGRALHGP